MYPGLHLPRSGWSGKELHGWMWSLGPFSWQYTHFGMVTIDRIKKQSNNQENQQKAVVCTSTCVQHTNKMNTNINSQIGQGGKCYLSISYKLVDFSNQFWHLHWQMFVAYQCLNNHFIFLYGSVLNCAVSWRLRIYYCLNCPTQSVSRIKCNKFLLLWANDHLYNALNSIKQCFTSPLNVKMWGKF